MASSPKVTGGLVILPHLKAMGWIATPVMLCSCIGGLSLGNGPENQGRKLPVTGVTLPEGALTNSDIAELLAISAEDASPPLNGVLPPRFAKSLVLD